MRVAVFSTTSYDRRFLDAANAAGNHDLDYHEPCLSVATAALAGEAFGRLLQPRARRVERAAEQVEQLGVDHRSSQRAHGRDQASL